MASKVSTDVDKGTDICPVCSEEVIKEGVRCDLCEFWHHSKCVKMPGDTYKALGRNTDPGKCGMLQWLCPGCQRGASKLMLLLQNIVTTQGKHEDKLKNIEENITDLYEKVDKCNQAIISTNTSNDRGKIDLNEMKNDVATELAERQKRELNVVIFGLPESDRSTTELRRDEEQNQLAKSIRNVVGCDIELKKLTRLGKKNEDGTPRPLRVTLRNLNDKIKLLSKAKCFHDSDDEVSKNLTFKPDQTPNEREIWKKLIMERNQEREACHDEEEKEKWQIRNNKVVRVDKKLRKQIERD